LRDGHELVRFTCELDAAACAHDAADPDKGQEQWVHVLPHGPEVQARDGRAFTVSDLERVVRDTELPMLVDWEHNSEGSRGDTRAAGWVEELKVEPIACGSRAGIWGRVRWTPQGREHVRTQHYRFLSPVVLGRRANSDKRQLSVERLASVALTNRPALRMHGIEQFREQLSQRFGSFAEAEEATMDKLTKMVREACGLTQDATEEQLVTALEPRLKSGDATSLREACTALTKERNDAIAKTSELEKELLSFKGEAFKREVEVFFDEGSRAGKIQPAAREKWLAFALKSTDNFSTFKDVIYPDLPVVGTPQRGDKGKPKREPLADKSEHGVDRAALRKLGLTDKQIAESEREVFRSKGGPGDEQPDSQEDDEDEDDEDDVVEDKPAPGQSASAEG
jgi:phage I-like protein